jgi:PAS domain S-box-containing protein
VAENHQSSTTDHLFRQVLENLAAGTAWVGDDGKIESISSAFAHLLGHRPSDLTAAQLVTFVASDDAPLFTHSLETALAHPMAVQNFHCHLLNAGGSHHPCDLSIISPDQANRAALVIALDVENIDDPALARQLEQGLGERRKELHALYQLNQELLFPGIGLEEACQAAVRVLEPAWQYPEATVVRVKIDNDLAQSDSFTETEWIQRADILVDQVTRGSIEVAYRNAQAPADEGPFLAEERSLIQAVAGHVEVWLAHRESDLLSSDRGSWLQHLLGNAPLVLFEFTLEGIFTLSEGQGLDVLGLAPGQAVGQSVFDHFIDDPDVIDSVKGSIAGEDVVGRVSAGGRMYQSRFSPQLEAGGLVIGVTGVAFDVTELDLSVEQIQRCEERFRSLASAIPDMMFIFDRNGICIEYVPAPGMFPSVEPGEFIGKRIDEVMPAGFAATAMAAIAEVFASNHPTTVEYEIDVPLGSGHFSNYEARIVPNPPDHVLVLVRDITKRVAAERSLKLIGGALNAAMYGVVITDPSGTLLWGKEAFTKLTGWTGDEAVGKTPRDLVKSGRHGEAFYSDLLGHDQIRQGLARQNHQPAQGRHSLFRGTIDHSCSRQHWRNHEFHFDQTRRNQPPRTGAGGRRSQQPIHGCR